MIYNKPNEKFRDVESDQPFIDQPLWWNNTEYR